MHNAHDPLSRREFVRRVSAAAAAYALIQPPMGHAAVSDYSSTSNRNSEADGDMSIQHRFVETNNLRMHIAETGAGPLVVLCHGFPELWYSWRHQLMY